jgi:DNA-binding XRE family transcriptional regulator
MSKEPRLLTDEGVQSHDYSYEALTMALQIVFGRIRALPAEDQNDLRELMKEIWTAETREDYDGFLVAMREILDQTPSHLHALDLAEEEGKTAAGLQKWMDFIGKKIRELRLAASLSQDELAKKTGLPQSHISRLEAGKHSPSRVTLEKIAKGLGVELGVLDPSA